MNTAMLGRLAVAIGVCSLALAASARDLVGATSGAAAFPGRNGEIVFSRAPVREGTTTSS